jgi:hypothetical protein
MRGWQWQIGKIISILLKEKKSINTWLITNFVNFVFGFFVILVA